MKTKAIEVFGKREIHISNGFANYATLCGMDGDDPDRDVGQITVKSKKSDKITCKQCYDIWKIAKSIPINLFDKSSMEE